MTSEIMTTGTVDIHFSGYHLDTRWTIPSFSTLKDKINSPTWSFGGQQWELRLYPHGFNIKDEGSLSLYLKKVTKDEANVHFSISIINMFNLSCYTYSANHVFRGNYWGYQTFITRRELVARGLVVGDILKIRCIMDIEELPEQDQVIVNVLDTGDVHHIFSGVIVLKHVDFDTTVNVKSQEFKVHRFVLSAQSEVFAAMFRHNMMESTSSVVTIDDCEPTVFKEFLRFLYSKQVKKLTCAEYQELYACAEKYLVVGLKAFCIRAIRGEFAIYNVVEILLFAETYGLPSLKTEALEFIGKMASKVAASSGWKKLHTHLDLLDEVMNHLASCIPSTIGDPIKGSLRVKISKRHIIGT